MDGKMTETEIRERIERFLKRTAEAVVVPATMGLGLSQVGCDHHSLEARPSDAGAEVQRSDSAVQSDVPDPILVYLVLMPADAADLASAPPDAGPDGKRDAGADAESEAGASIDTAAEAPLRIDLGPELPMPPPPYLAVLPPDPPPAAPDARPDAPEARPDAAETRPDTFVPDVLPPPPPPYLSPPPPLPAPSTPSKK
jgi:hypothetical protein